MNIVLGFPMQDLQTGCYIREAFEELLVQQEQVINELGVTGDLWDARRMESFIPAEAGQLTPTGRTDMFGSKIFSLIPPK